jgi:hypothetical protein
MKHKIKVTYSQTNDRGDREWVTTTILVDLGVDVYSAVCRLPGRLGWTPEKKGIFWETVFSA